MSKTQLQSLLGHMSFASRAIRGVRTFSRIFIDRLVKISNCGVKMSLDELVRKELKWWINISPLLNGMCPSKFGFSRRKVFINTDASLAESGSDFDMPQDPKYRAFWVPSSIVHESFRKKHQFFGVDRRVRSRFDLVTAASELRNRYC